MIRCNGCGTNSTIHHDTPEGRSMPWAFAFTPPPELKLDPIHLCHACVWSLWQEHAMKIRKRLAMDAEAEQEARAGGRPLGKREA